MEMFFVVILFLALVCVSLAQYRNNTQQYSQSMEAGIETLIGEIQSHPDVNLMYYPERGLISADSYVYDYPLSQDYRIGLLIDPCRLNAYNCCMNVYGSAEYRALLASGLEAERVYQYKVLANETDVSSNFILVYEDGSTIVASAQRSPDDEEVWNNTCVSDGVPYSFCQGRNYALQRSDTRPPCLDNNQSLDATSGCYFPNGTYNTFCFQLAFTSNTFIAKCSDSSTIGNCGTYLEIHMAHGSPYYDETTILGEALVEPRNVSGYYTMTMATTFMFNTSRLLCSYTESVLRVGSLVYVKASAPVCCCPAAYNDDSRVGAFQCPVGFSSLRGAWATAPDTVAEKLSADSLNLNYPFCHISTLDGEDRMMCSTHDVRDRKYFTRNCTTVNQTDPLKKDSWSSKDMRGLYNGICPYYPGCALTTAGTGTCQFTDEEFSFRGQVGLITALDNSVAIPQAWVTFNNGRTSYQFNQQDIKLETAQKSMYELWWVVRSHSEYTVQKRKGFNVTSPDCTFDTTNNRYFPYAIYKNGTTMPFSATP